MRSNCGHVDAEIHDAGLIAAAFSMLDRFVNGIAIFARKEHEASTEMGHRIVAEGSAR